jgi:lipid II:glycine glycyltransferase (peptidoglycan interpeptide bridge formation enzyme)
MKIYPFGERSSSLLADFVWKQPASFLQTPFWADFKKAHGWRPLYFRMEESDTSSGRLLVVLIRAFSRFASIAYVPMGPDIPCVDPAEQGRLLGVITAAVAPYLPKNTICIRYDPPWGLSVSISSFGDNEGMNSGASALHFPLRPSKPARRAPVNIQPPDTVILDLAKSPEELLSEMKSKWRYNIKLSEKKGVSISFLEGEKGACEGIDTFYRLYLDTAKRDGIAIHSKDYYRDLVRRASSNEVNALFGKPPSVRVYIAYHEGMPLASIITLISGDVAVYLYGASSNEKRNLMPSYGLQWKSIIDAREAGCTRYDFYGIPPTDDPSHPMYGLYRFKTGFGGSVVHRVGSCDIQLRPLSYKIYRIIESGRTLWYKKIMKLLKKETPQRS